MSRESKQHSRNENKEPREHDKSEKMITGTKIHINRDISILAGQGFFSLEEIYKKKPKNAEDIDKNTIFAYYSLCREEKQ